MKLNKTKTYCNTPKNLNAKVEDGEREQKNVGFETIQIFNFISSQQIQGQSWLKTGLGYSVQKGRRGGGVKVQSRSDTNFSMLISGTGHTETGLYNCVNHFFKSKKLLQ